MTRYKEIQTWTVRNRKGQYIGSYRAMTAAQAVDKFMQEQIAYASHFKTSVFKREEFSASIEARP